MKKVGIIGTGYVGLTHGTMLAEKGNYVICCDHDNEKIDKIQKGIMPLYEPGLSELVKKNCYEGRLSFTTITKECVENSDFIFICVNTPPKQTMSGMRKADLSYVEKVAKEIAQNMNGYKIVIDKSTVPIKTGEKVYETISKSEPEYEFDVVSNPEFLREGKAVTDTLNPDRIVIGVMRDENGNLAERPLKAMRELYSNFNTTMLETDIWSAELIKLASNAYLANQISFINKISEICALTGADVKEVARGMRLDKRIGQHAFLDAGVGFGGSCFPKDIESLCNIQMENKLDPNFFQQILEVNQTQKDFFLNIIEEGLWTIKDKEITVLGLSFKQDTDDMREAPSIRIINKLCEEGAKIRVYDPKAIEEAKKHFKEKVTYSKNLYEAVERADAIILLTEWEEFKNMNLEKIKELMNKPSYIFDGRNIFEPKEMGRKGFYYHSIGRQHAKPERENNKK